MIKRDYLPPGQRCGLRAAWAVQKAAARMQTMNAYESIEAKSLPVKEQQCDADRKQRIITH